MAGPLISMRDINKYYAMGEEQAHILKDVNLSVASGEYLSILGPSGSGKSTLMNIIGCLDTPTSGSYLLNGEAVEELSQVELAGIRSRIRVLFFEEEIFFEEDYWQGFRSSQGQALLELHRERSP